MQKNDSYREHIEAKRRERDEKYTQQRAQEQAIHAGLTACAEELRESMPGMPAVAVGSLVDRVPTDLTLAETMVLGIFLATTAENRITVMAADTAAE